MQLSAVILARFIGFVETYDVDPRGKVFYPELFRGLITKFSFQKFPEKWEDVDEQKGIDFFDGKWRGIAVEKLTIYANGILLDTRSSTDDSERILEESLLWASSEFGLGYRTGMINRKGYLSQLSFFSEVPLLAGLNMTLPTLSKRFGEAVGRVLGIDVKCEPGGISINYDDVSPPRVAPFTIQRRGGTAFSENKYYSEAPLPTDLHLELIEKFESELGESISSSRRKGR